MRSSSALILAITVGVTTAQAARPATGAGRTVKPTMKAMQAVAGQLQRQTRQSTNFSNVSTRPVSLGDRSRFDGIELTVVQRTRGGTPVLVRRLFRKNDYGLPTPLCSTFFYDGGKAVRRYHASFSDHGWGAEPGVTETLQIQRDQGGVSAAITRQGRGRWRRTDKPQAVAGLVQIGGQTLSLDAKRQLQPANLTVWDGPKPVWGGWAPGDTMEARPAHRYRWQPVQLAELLRPGDTGRLSAQQTARLWEVLETRSMREPAFNPNQPNRPGPGPALAGATGQTGRAVAATPRGMLAYVKRRLAGGPRVALEEPANLVSWKAVPIPRAEIWRAGSWGPRQPYQGIQLTVRSKTRGGKERLVQRLYKLEDYVGPSLVQSTFFYPNGRARRVYTASAEVDHGQRADSTTALVMKTAPTADGATARVIRTGRGRWRRASKPTEVFATPAGADPKTLNPVQTKALWDRAIGSQ